ncbi:MAG: hypothetical protein GWN00_03995 [Aliifodinibius sp.]|nr:hypothetical protein [Fodinibius sp.]NIW98551.1 hypothetical protein [Phycisphaerae bacterium]NIY23996.1 hypothetical protein [Fodinibius sp.]
MALTVDKTLNRIKVTGTTGTSSEVFGDQIFVKHIYWFNPTTAGHLCTIVDKNGKTIIPMRCESDAVSQIWPIISVCDQIHITDMDSGTLMIYTR